MRYQVPQFIEVEDKVFFGLLTIKQMAYMGAAFLLTAGAYKFFSFTFFMIFGVLFFGLATAFAFIKINGVIFPRLLKATFKFFWQPQVYVWKPTGELMAQAEKISGKSPQEKLSELKTMFKSKISAASSKKETSKTLSSGSTKILVDQPLIRGFGEKVRQTL